MSNSICSLYKGFNKFKRLQPIANFVHNETHTRGVNDVKQTDVHTADFALPKPLSLRLKLQS